MASRRLLWLTAACLFVAACARQEHPPAADSAAAAPPPVSFVDRVWRVHQSSSVAPGMLYVFLSEGTLVIASPYGTPALGTWKLEGDTFTMVEEGLPYRVEVLELSAGKFRIRINNPGAPIEIAFVLAAAAPSAR